MNTTTLPAGTTVYNLQGDAAEIVMPHPDMKGYMVYPLYEAHEGDEEFTERGPLTHWPDTYVAPPVEKKNAEIAELDAKIAEKKRFLLEISKTTRLVESTIATDKKRLAALQGRSAVISRIEDFLDGKITHYVKSESWNYQNELGGGWAITTPQEEKSGNEPRERDLKLLTLFGKANGDLGFRLHYYSDGTGGNYSIVFPCCGLEEAERLVREKINAQVAAWTADPKAYSSLLETIIANLKRFRMEIPAPLTEALREMKLESARRNAATRQAELDKAMEELKRAEEAE